MLKKNSTTMKTKTFFILVATLLFVACNVETEKIKGQAVIVNNFKEKKPLEGIYIEVQHTEDEGYNYDFLQGITTDKHGFFEINVKYKIDFMCIDCWAVANVYSDIKHTDTLGSFSFPYANNTYSYQTICLDTFSLPHNVWVVPKIIDLGGYHPDEIEIDFGKSDVVDSAQKNMSYTGSIQEHQTFTPVQIKMSMNIQHWLSYGSRDLATGFLKKNSKQIGFGYFHLSTYKRTVEGDTLYLNFYLNETK